MKYNIVNIVGILAAVAIAAYASPSFVARKDAQVEELMKNINRDLANQQDGDMQQYAEEEGNMPSLQEIEAQLQKAGLPGSKQDEVELQEDGENVKEQDDDAMAEGAPMALKDSASEVEVQDDQAMVEQVLSNQSVEAQGKWYRYYRHYYILYCRWRSYYYRLLRYYKVYRHHYIVYRNLYYRCVHRRHG